MTPRQIKAAMPRIAELESLVDREYEAKINALIDAAEKFTLGVLEGVVEAEAEPLSQEVLDNYYNEIFHCEMDRMAKEAGLR